MHRLGSIAALAALLLVVGGCQQGDGVPAPTPSASPSDVATDPGTTGAGIPHVRGPIELALQSGRKDFTTFECVPGKQQHQACSADGKDTYATTGRVRPLTLLEARMELNDAHTSWTFLLRFTRPSGKALDRTAAEATSSGAAVLILDTQGAVVLAVLVREVSDGTVSMGGLTKAEAWALVEHFVSV